MTPEEMCKVREKVDDIDRRVISLESWMKANDASLERLDINVSRTSSDVSVIRDMLGDHMVQEEKDRSRFYYGIALTLLAAVGTLVTVLLQHALSVQP